jgi:signal transduction histidine kinase
MSLPRQGDAVTILVAEDSPTQAEQLRHLLQARGFAVSLAPNGRLALESARRSPPTLVISDIVMPEMDGYALCRALKADPDLRDVPVVLVTALSGVQDIAQSLEAGADNLIRKPYDPDNLLARVEYILANRELRRERRAGVGLQIVLGGRRHFITSEREQILDLLVSSFEEAVRVNGELARREKEVSELNARLAQHAAELEAANRELESFSYSVSHDLRAPLRAVSGFSRILAEDYGGALDGEGRRLVQTIRQGAARMEQLIEDLLELSRVGRTQLARRPIDMTAIVRRSLAELQAAGEARPERCVLEPLPEAWGDPQLVEQVWANLLSNAFKYSSVRAEPLVRVSGRSAGGASYYSVADNGVGFDPRHGEKLFRVFQRLHGEDEFPGTGVGLAIVQRIVARHGGRVWAEARLDEGATFHFMLPDQGNVR